MSDITKQRIAMFISNTVRIGCFTVLSIELQKWWIIFLVLFLDYEKKEK